MTLQEFSVALQSISSFAIAGGFVYVALQFREARKAAHVANFSRLVELQMQLRRIRVEHPALARVHENDLQGLESDEDVRFYFLNLMQLSLFEIAWFSHRHGQIPDDYFQSWVERMESIAGEPSFRKMMGTGGTKIMHDEFQSYVQSIVARTGGGPRG